MCFAVVWGVIVLCGERLNVDLHDNSGRAVPVVDFSGFRSRLDFLHTSCE